MVIGCLLYIVLYWEFYLIFYSLFYNLALQIGEKNNMNSLTKPIYVKNHLIPSKIFFAPINPGYSIDGKINNNYIDFFLKRAGNGVGICYIGNVAIEPEFKTNTGTAVLMKEQLEKWSQLSHRIKLKGSQPGIQLAWKPSNMYMQKNFYNPNKEDFINLSRKYCKEFKEYDLVIKQFVEKIKFSEYAGFNLIQLHAAHGYALSLLLSGVVNDITNPEDSKGYKLLEHLMDKNLNKELIWDIRISLFEGIDSFHNELQYKEKLLKSIQALGFDIISLSNGLYNIDKHMIYPPKSISPIILEPSIELANKNPQTIWNIAGNMEKIFYKELPPNLTISLGRQLLADPLFIKKINCGKENEILTCTECNRCHYYSNMLPGIVECDTSHPPK